MNENKKNALYKPQRSCLYTPAIHKKALIKAASLPADTIIIDLEDAVAPDQKAQAREAVSEIMASHILDDKDVIIRSNALDSIWGEDDLAFINKIKPSAMLAPKIRSADDIKAIDALLKTDITLWAMIEMPLAILNIQSIAAASKYTKLTGFVIGTNDLAKEFRAISTPDRAAFQHALSMTLTAARAYDLIAIDGVYNDMKNDVGLETECRQGQIMGFDGKTLIHPSQIKITNQIFSPSEKDIARSHAIIAAFTLPENQNKAVIKVDGQMTELLHLAQAKRIISIHEAIKIKALEPETLNETTAL